MDIRYRPAFTMTPLQRKVWDHPARFKVIKAGRRWGKTMLGIERLRQWALTSASLPLARKLNMLDRLEVCYSAKTHKQAEDVGFETFLRTTPEELVKKVNRRTLQITVENGTKYGCKVTFTGSERADNLRGRPLAGLVKDEAAFQSDVFSPIFRPMLLDLQGPAWFLSSPKKGWYSHMWDMANSGEDPEFAAFKFTIYDSIHDPKEIESIKKTTSEDVWRCEYLAEEIESDGVIYGEFDPILNIVDARKVFPNHQQWPGVAAVDPGIWDPTGMVFIHIDPKGEFAVVSSEHVRGGWDMSRHSEVLQTKSRGRNIDRTNYVMDRSAFRREMSSGTSVADQARQQTGISFQKSEKDLNASIDIVKRLLRGDGQKPALFIDVNCAENISGFKTWEHGQHEPDGIAATRYALTHAVRKGMLKQPGLRHEYRKLDSETPSLSIPSLKSVRRIGPSRWTIDPDFGVPA